MNKQDTLKQYKTTNELQSKTVLSRMLSDLSKDDIPMVIYKLQQPLRFKLFNRINFFIQNGNILLCHHENSPFLDPQ